MADSRSERSKPVVLFIALIVLALLVAAGLVYFLVLGGGGPFSTTARTLTSVNLREGPGVSYPTAGSLPAGGEVKVVGRNQDGTWLLVETESGQAWMTANSQYVEIDEQALAKLEVVEAAAPAYDASNPVVNQVMNQIPLVVHHSGNFTCASHAGLNNLLPEVAEGHVIGPHSGDFALVGLGGNVLFERAGGSVRLIRDNPVARFENDQKYLPLETALKMFAEGEIVWTGRFGDWPGRGVPGCDESAKPE